MPEWLRREQTMISGVFAEPNSRQVNYNPPALPTGIPTHDADAALAFGRALAQVMNGTPLATTAGAVQQGLNRPILSVVIPVCNEQENLDELYSRLVRALAAAEPDFEVLFVDDGSRDASLNILAQLAQN